MVLLIPIPPWSTFLFRKVMENESFRNRFINQYADNLNSRFLPERLGLHIDTILAKVKNETIRHLNRWGEDVPNWEEHVERMKVFAEERPPYARAHILSEFQLSSMQTIHTELAQPDFGYIQLNSLQLRDSSWSGIYFEGVPIQLTAVAIPGYRFEKWTGDITSTETSISLDLTAETSITAHFIEAPFEDFGIVINEINYNSSKAYDTEDWIELTNTSDEPRNLAGWIFKDGDDDHSFEIPPSTILAPKEYLVLCRDVKDFDKVNPDQTNRIGEFDFGLSSKGEALRLYDPLGYLQDSVWYLSAAPWPTRPNGSGATLSLIDPQSDNALSANWESMEAGGTPGKRNEQNSPGPPPGAIPEVRVFPNPTSGDLYLYLADLEEEEISLDLYSPVGKRLWALTAKKEELSDGVLNLDISGLQAGIYYLRIDTENKALTFTLLKL